MPHDHRSLCNTESIALNEPITAQTFKGEQECADVSFHVSESYSVVIRGIWVLVTSNDLGSHPIWSPDEGVPPPNGPIQLGANAKVHWTEKATMDGQTIDDLFET